MYILKILCLWKEPHVFNDIYQYNFSNKRFNESRAGVKIGVSASGIIESSKFVESNCYTPNWVFVFGSFGDNSTVPHSHSDTNTTKHPELVFNVLTLGTNKTSQ